MILYNRINSLSSMNASKIISRNLEHLCCILHGLEVRENNLEPLADHVRPVGGGSTEIHTREAGTRDTHAETTVGSCPTGSYSERAVCQPRYGGNNRGTMVRECARRPGTFARIRKNDPVARCKLFLVRGRW